MRVLVTRPEENAKDLQKELRILGVTAVHEPMLRIERIADAKIDLEGVQGLLFTSSNGVRAFAALCEERDLPAYAVGDSTAGECRTQGFPEVESASGDVDALANLIVRQCSPDMGRLVHIAGSVTAGDLAGALKASGFEVDRIPLYEAHAATELSEDTRTALLQGRLDAILFFSPRTAATFVSLVRAAGLEKTCRSLYAYCLSAAVASRIGELPWKRVLVAAEPSQAALLDVLKM